MKIENDKYYTPKSLAEYCVNKTKEWCPDITEYLEPSGGGWSIFRLSTDRNFKL